jgi:Ser/Thr protein kinase RdoA (MazF antagonist)
LKPTDSHLQLVRSLWKLSGEIRFVRKVENWIYHDPERALFLRITEPTHRDSSALGAELAWMEFLHGRGIRLARPLASSIGNLFEEVEAEGRRFFVSVFRQAEGERLPDPDGFTPAVMESWGRTLGSLHAASREYPLAARPQWNQERNYRLIHNQLAGCESRLRDRFLALDAWLAALPREPGEYGLVHADLHHGNFHVDSRNELTVFDFDDCQYQWLAYDIAIPFFYILYSFHRKGVSRDWEEVFAPFAKGYASVHPLSDFRLKAIPRFLEYRTFVLYFWCLTHLESESLDPTSRQWLGKAMAYCRDRIERA